MRTVLITAALMLVGCAGAFHKPDVSSSVAEVKTQKVCTMNVLGPSIFDPVIIEGCATAAGGTSRLVTRFGTMHEETAQPGNWKIEILDPAGEMIINDSNLQGTTVQGACGTGGCSKEGHVTTLLPRPWSKGSYTIRYTSKAQPVIEAISHLTFTE